MKHRRLDVNRAAAAIGRPGIDTRMWLTLAAVEDVGFDATEGIFVDVRFLPLEEPETARVACGYAGDGFGAYAPLQEGDTVLVAVPRGDSNEGPIIIARIWTAADKPPAELAGTTSRGGTPDPILDPYLRVQPGKKLKVRTSADGGDLDIVVEGNGTTNIEARGSGTITIQQKGTGDIKLKVENGHVCYVGDDVGAEPIALGQTLQTFLGGLKTWMDAHTHTGVTVGAGATLIPLAPSPAVPTVTATKGKVK